MAGLSSRCSELAKALEQESSMKHGLEKQVEELSGVAKKWEVACGDLRAQSSDMSSQLVRLRAEVEARSAHEAAAASVVDDQLSSLRQQVRRRRRRRRRRRGD
jgi:hypothetical protein